MASQQENQTSHERTMAKVNNAVVYFKNITKEPFEHTYDGIPYQIAAGETVPLPFPVGDLLARHLAMRILRADKIKSDVDKQSKVLNLYTDDRVNALIAKIITKRVERSLPAAMTEGERMKAKTEELKKELGPEIDAQQPQVSKKQIIADLTKRGIKHDPRASREVLLQLIVDDEAKGGGEGGTE